MRYDDNPYEDELDRMRVRNQKRASSRNSTDRKDIPQPNSQGRNNTIVFLFPIPAGTELKILGEPSPKLVLNIQEIPPEQGRREEAARLLRPLLNRDTVRRLLIVQAVIPEKNGEKQAF